MLLKDPRLGARCCDGRDLEFSLFETLVKTDFCYERKLHCGRSFFFQNRKNILYECWIAKGTIFSEHISGPKYKCLTYLGIKSPLCKSWREPRFKERQKGQRLFSSGT